MNKPTLIDRPELKRFELEIEGETAYVEYIINKVDVIYLTHTEVPQTLEGKGVASEMIKSVLNEIKSRELKLIPICPFVTSYLMRHPEWKSMLDENHRF